MEYQLWAKDYLQQAKAINIQIKRLRQQLQFMPESEQSGINVRIYMLYQMYLDCKHISEYLDKRARVYAFIEKEREKITNGKTAIESGYINRKHPWGATVSISG